MDAPLFDPFKALAEIRREAGSASPEKLSQKLSQPPAKAIHEQEQRLESTFATFAAFAGSDPAPTLAPARVKEEERKENLIKSYTYARTEASGTPPPALSPKAPAKVAKPAKVSLSHSEQRERPEIEAAKVFDDGLRKWRLAFAALSPDRIPCPGYTSTGWASVHARVLAFLDTFGDQAEALGWTAPRLFNVHPEIGVIRPDACGGLVLPIGGPVRAITAATISFGHLTHRDMPGRAQGVLVWDFGR